MIANGCEPRKPRGLRATAWRRVRGGVMLLFISTASAPADPPQEIRATAPQSAPTPPQSEKKPAARRPQYLDLRYDEDFSHLEGDPSSYTPDPFDRLKNIPLGRDLRLNIGGEFRFRLEAETNLNFGAAERTQDTFQLYRYLLHFDLRLRDHARVFLQLGMFHDEDRDLPDRPFDENRGTLHQGFLDVKLLGGSAPLTLRIGRQELSYGKQRFLSPLDWANTRRRFDTVKLIWKEETWQLDAFWSRPIPVQRNHFDDWNEDVHFSGAYFSYAGVPRHVLEIFTFALNDTGERLNPNGRAGDISRYTIGTRLVGKAGAFDYEAEVAGQWGSWASDRIHAFAAAVDAGYTWKEATWSPRLGVGVDWATGDRDPADGSVETFDQLFPLGHAFLGYIDLIGRQNVQAGNVNLTVWPIAEKVSAQLAAHMFWLDSDQDALYGAGGQSSRRDPSGDSGRRAGCELDATLAWNLSVHQSLLLGYSHFWPGDFVDGTGASEDADLLYLQYRLRF